MSNFFRFPHTPHLAWLSERSAREDKVLSAHEAKTLLKGIVTVEEKIDGANLGISLNSSGEIQFQNRGEYLFEPYSGQFSRLSGWLRQHEFALKKILRPEIILFGEWCAAKHSLEYTHLEDWFLLFDVYDRNLKKFWSIERRNLIAKDAGLAHVPKIYQGCISISYAHDILSSSKSKYRLGNPEGIIIRKDSEHWNEVRAKLVRPDFSQSISEHWRKQSITWNKCVE